jgi:type II secretory pathway component GspD/PulD (secretin)
MSLEGQAATFHLGDRYPVITQQFTGAGEGEEVPENAYRPPPTIQFEDLGVVVKITPWIHGLDEVTLEVSAEYKVLAGEALNGIPVISNRKYESRVRVRFGEAVVVAGLVGNLLTKGKGGFPMLGPLAPFLNSNSDELNRQELLLVLTPKLTAVPPAETSTYPIWVGSESRPRTPIAH